MKKTKLIALLSALLCLTMLFASCGGKTPKLSKISDFYVKDAEPKAEPTLSKTFDLGTFKYISLEDYDDKLVIFETTTEVNGKDVTGYKVVNLETGSVVLSVEESETTVEEITTKVEYDVSLESYENYFYVEKVVSVTGKPDDVTVTLYQNDGSEIATVDNEDDFATIIYRRILSAGKDLYEYTDKKWVKYGTLANGAAIPDGDIFGFSDDYIYVFGDASFVVYDRLFNPVSYYEFPQNADTTTGCGVLTNGKIFLQYLVALPDDAKEYDYYNKGKYDIVTLLIDPKNCEQKEVDVNYILTDDYIYNALGSDTEEESVMTDIFNKYNLVRVCVLDDSKQDTVSKTYLMDNKGNLKKEAAVVKDGLYAPSLVAKNVYESRTKYGYTVLTDAKGKVISKYNGNISRYDSFLFDRDEKVLYNFDMTEIAKLDKEENPINSNYYDNAIMTSLHDDTAKKTVYSIYTAAGKNVIAEVKDADLAEGDVTKVNIYSFGYAITKKTADGTTTAYYTIGGTAVSTDTNCYDFWCSAYFVETLKDADPSNPNPNNKKVSVLCY